LDVLHDPTARAIPGASHQATQGAAVAGGGHERIADKIAYGDLDGAARLMLSHIDPVEVGLTKRIYQDPLIDRRSALQPSLRPGRDQP
jgi:hypothetical protein